MRRYRRNPPSVTVASLRAMAESAGMDELVEMLSDSDFAETAVTVINATLAEVEAEQAAASAAEAERAAAEERTRASATADKYDAAMRAVSPSNWRPLLEFYVPPTESKQREVEAWLNRYARTAQDAKDLLDGRDNAPEFGMRSDDYDEIAKKLGFSPIAPTPTRDLTDREGWTLLAQTVTPAVLPSLSEEERAALRAAFLEEADKAAV